MPFTRQNVPVLGVFNVSGFLFESVLVERNPTDEETI